MTEEIYQKIARFATDVAASYTCTHHQESEYTARTGFYGAKETHTKQWKEQKYDGDILPDIAIEWGWGTSQRGRKLMLEHEGAELEIQYSLDDGIVDVIDLKKDKMPDKTKQSLNKLVEKAYDWSMLDEVSDEAAAVLNDVEGMVRQHKENESEMVDAHLQAREQYEKALETLDPPMDGVPITTGREELEKRLEEVYRDLETSRMMASRIISANNELFPEGGDEPEHIKT